MEKMILDELMELMQCQKAPSFKNHTSYTKGIPQYGLELDQLILEIGKFENNFPNFHILGNYFNGVSVSDCVKKSEELVEHTL
jgi:protoporphyrinogen oxidase